ncbi:MAG: hypothetical protein KDI13_09570 [Alphaproteobacteria bacterium]|nr:hypothetical protein [Alphaproteobacteria bacterium]
MNINTSLLREKFIIRDLEAEEEDNALNLEVRSNRMAVPLRSGDLEEEIYVVRAHNMHSCARMVSRIVHSYSHVGPIASRNPPFDWEDAWNTVIDDYERAYIPEHWVCVYYKGRILYESGDHHPFLDIIEKCDAVNKGDYEKSIKLAQDAFSKAGKNIDIKYESNIALVVDIERQKGRCGMILRGPERTTTFNMTMERSETRKTLDASQCITAASAFLEGIQLAFKVGINLEKISIGKIKQYSPEEKATREARRRLGRLNAEINTLQNNAKVRYRPERPDFFEIVVISERLAQKTLRSSEESYHTSYGDDN